jgi:hypothetical protein
MKKIAKVAVGKSTGVAQAFGKTAVAMADCVPARCPAIYSDE